MNNVKTPIALRYLLNRRHQITNQMSQLIDISPKQKWDERAKKELKSFTKRLITKLLTKLIYLNHYD